MGFGPAQGLVASAILAGATGGPLYLTKNGAGAPPYTFAGDTDTGWDSDAANTISGYTSGTLRFTLNTAALTLTLDLQGVTSTFSGRVTASTDLYLTGQIVINSAAAATVGGAYRGFGVGNANNASEGFVGSAYMFSTAGGYPADGMFTRNGAAGAVKLTQIDGTTYGSLAVLELKSGTVKVVGAQGAAVADAGAGAVAQVAATSATILQEKVDLILARLRAHGLIAT